jgi:hypothetical protein
MDKPLGRQRAGGDVEDRGGEFAGDLVHVRDHQQQALRRREGRGQRTGLEGAVNRAGRAAFRLHLDHRRDRSPEVLGARRGPGIGPFAHRRRRGDGVDGDDFAQLVGDAGDGFVAVEGVEFLLTHGENGDSEVEGTLGRQSWNSAMHSLSPCWW